MWDPPKTEDDTPWATPESGEPTQRIAADSVQADAPEVETSAQPAMPPMPAPHVADDASTSTFPPAPNANAPLLGAPPAPPAPTDRGPINAPPAPPAPPSPFSLSSDSPSPVAAPAAPPSAFTAIGAPTASIPVAPTSPTVLSSGPSVTPRPAAMPIGSAPSVAPTTQVTEPTKRRRWPWLLLALSTVAASGLLAWLVATNVQPEPAPVAVPAAEVAPPPTETAAAPADETVDLELLADEPFAAAAELIRTSVVRLEVANGHGTGVIINSNGTILTAAHVVGNNQTVRVIFADGSSIDGEVVGTHEPTDVAVISVSPEGRDLVPARLAAGSDVRVGQLAVAVGSPFGFDQTVTAGIISAVDRIVPGSDASFVQTDAPINPGNSGGPLINLDGEVVGINDLIFTESGDNAGVGFAISIDLAIIIADQIVAGVEPQVALLGVSTGPPPNGEAGALVEAVTPGSAAEAAGLQLGDIVVGVNDTNTRGSSDLRAQIIDQAPGSDIELSVIRNGEQIELAATLGRTG